MINTICSCRGPGFKFQHIHGGSLLMSMLDLSEHQACIWHTKIQTKLEGMCWCSVVDWVNTINTAKGKMREHCSEIQCSAQK